MKHFICLFMMFSVFGQEAQNVFSFDEYIGFVKKFHPLVKSANLEVSSAQANLMVARGGFDPKIDVDFDTKKFKSSDYFSILNSSFKVPTWYGIELKAGFENNEGVFLNPENTLPNPGLMSFGIKVPLAQGLLINTRMADLRKAKLQLKLSDAERRLQTVGVITDACFAYFNWKKTFDEVVLYQQYSKNAQLRYQGILSLISAGDKPQIDSVEANIIVNNRLLSLEDALLKLNKAKLELSNFIWLNNSIPMELSDNLIPDPNLEISIQETLKTNSLFDSNFNIQNHPKISALENKVAILKVDQKLKANYLLPKIDVGYSYLTEPTYINNYKFDDYKVGVNFSLPIFLRKERGNLKIAKFKVQQTQFDLDLEKIVLTNKIKSQRFEIESVVKQSDFIEKLVIDNQKMLTSEERLFSVGESSILLINSRENNLITAQLAKISIKNRLFISNSELYRILVNIN